MKLPFETFEKLLEYNLTYRKFRFKNGQKGKN